MKLKEYQNGPVTPSAAILGQFDQGTQEFWEASSVKVKVFGTLRSVIGQKQIKVSLDQKNTVGAVLEQLKTRYPELKEKLGGEGEIPPTGVNILVNGRSIEFLNGLNTSLEEDDRVALFPPLGGG
jgi:molybdopterin synthase sulfur carrier subunit